MTCAGVGALALLTGALSGSVTVALLGIGTLLLSVVVFCVGLLADLLRQIMVK